jgi:hypothetical protein
MSFKNPDRLKKKKKPIYKAKTQSSASTEEILVKAKKPKSKKK